jgi:hypothetical protein
MHLTADSRWAPIIPGVRKLALLPCVAIAAIAVGASVGAAAPTGTLSVEQGKGTVTIEIRGSVLGRLDKGTVRITDLSPRDRFVPVVAGRRLTVRRTAPRTLLYKGQALRFRMLGGSSRLVVKGNGMSVSAVGRGHVTLDGDRRFPEDVAGYYSLDGTDCALDVSLCTPLPDFPERHVIGPQPVSTGSRIG